MFIHIGDNHIIQSKEIVSIIDRHVIPSSIIMEELMQAHSRNSQVFGPEEEAKSVVITPDCIYYSTLSVPTLKKRARMIFTIKKLEDYSEELE